VLAARRQAEKRKSMELSGSAALRGAAFWHEKNNAKPMPMIGLHSDGFEAVFINQPVLLASTTG